MLGCNNCYAEDPNPIFTFLPINHFERFGKQITLCESLLSFSQFLPEPDTGLLNLTSLRKPLNSACPTLHKPLKTPIRCLRTPHLHDTFDKAIRVIRLEARFLIRAVSTETRHRSANLHFPTTTAGILESFSAQIFKKTYPLSEHHLNSTKPWSKTLGFQDSVCQSIYFFMLSSAKPSIGNYVVRG